LREPKKPVTGNPMNCRSLDIYPGCGPNDAIGQVVIPSLLSRIERFGVSRTNGIERALFKNYFDDRSHATERSILQEKFCRILVLLNSMTIEHL
jgi:hypothetical protein